MLGPHVRPVRVGRFIAILMRRHSGTGIVAKMAVDVDDPRGNELARAVDHDRIGRHRDHIARPDRRDQSVAQQHYSLLDPPAVTVIDRRTTDHRSRGGIARIGRRKRIGVDPDRPRLARRCAGGNSENRRCNNSRFCRCAPHQTFASPDRLVPAACGSPNSRSPAMSRSSSSVSRCIHFLTIGDTSRTPTPIPIAIHPNSE